MAKDNGGKLFGGLSSELDKLGQSAHNIGPWKDTGGVDAARVGFMEGSATNKFAVLSGGITGMAVMLKGTRNIRNGLSKNESGKRDFVTAILGAAEIASGALMTGTFYERVKMNGAGPDGGIER